METARVETRRSGAGAMPKQLGSAFSSDSPAVEVGEVGGAVFQREALPQRARSGAPPPLTPNLVLRLQGLAGNAAVAATLLSRAGGASSVQRQNPPDVPVKTVKLSASRVSVPTEAGLSLKATAQPATATGVTFSVDKGSVAATGVTIDATTGDVTIADTQPGGSVTVKAVASDGSWATSTLQVVEKPNGIASTTASSAGGSVYGGTFTHTMSAVSGNSSALAGENMNEKFDSRSAATPFGPFALSANPAGSAGWFLDSSGTMTGPDNVDIAKSTIDVGRFVTSTSNRSPKSSLPTGFTMVQHLHAKSFPSGKLDDKPFVDVNHVRTLTDKSTFVVEAGKNKTEDTYVGPAAYTNAKATPASITASPPKPKAPKGGTAPAWTRNTVQVTADVIPTTGAKVFAITGAKLGCQIDAGTGEVLIGDKPGTITVRAWAGRGSNFDEATITIAKP